MCESGDQIRTVSFLSQEYDNDPSDQEINEFSNTVQKPVEPKAKCTAGKWVNIDDWTQWQLFRNRNHGKFLVLSSRNRKWKCEKPN